MGLKSCLLICSASAALLKPLVVDGQTKSRQDLHQSAAKVEAACSKKNLQVYLEQMAEFWETVATSRDAFPSAEVILVISNFLSTELQPIETGNAADLTFLRKSILYLLNDESPESKERNTQLLCKCRGKLHKEIIPNFKPKRVFANVAPPPGISGFSGMSPEAIPDPLKRSQYEAALRENELNGILNHRQSLLNGLASTYDSLIEDYLFVAFSRNPHPEKEITECLNSGVFSSEEKAAFMDKLKAAQLKAKSPEQH